jgi:arginase family enzyme
MDFEFLSPVEDVVMAHSQLLPKQSLGRSIAIHTKQTGVPDIEGASLAIIGINEFRNAVVKHHNPLSPSQIRNQLYQLYPGNWNVDIVDLGDVNPGATVQDTYFAVQRVCAFLLQNKVIPILIGGSQDVTYAAYRAYDDLNEMVNLVSVDSRFDFGDAEELISSHSYISKIIVDKPNNLFNFSNLGYQTYYNAQEEIDLMDKLYFDAYRLGEVISDITVTEPILRDANLVSIDMGAVKTASVSSSSQAVPNGFDSREICAIARYAGISEKVSLFGIFECNENYSASLIAQIAWYFMEGFNFRIEEEAIASKEAYKKYIVLIDNEELNFYKSVKSGRWWIEIPFMINVNNKLKRQTLLPCTYSDYLDACDQKRPERWWKAFKKSIA